MELKNSKRSGGATNRWLLRSPAIAGLCHVAQSRKRHDSALLPHRQCQKIAGKTQLGEKGGRPLGRWMRGKVRPLTRLVFGDPPSPRFCGERAVDHC